MHELGRRLNQASLDNLLLCLSHVSTKNNLLILPHALSKLLNFLTAFLVLKEAGNFDKSVWLEELSAADQFQTILLDYNALIVIVTPDEQSLAGLKALWLLLGRKSVRVNLIVKDLTLSFYYQLNSEVLGLSTEDLLRKSIDFDLSTPQVKLPRNCMLIPWKSHPVCIEDFIFSLEMENGGLNGYFKDPLSLVSSLLRSVTGIVAASVSSREALKFGNFYAKGDHASLLGNNIINEKIPEFIANDLSLAEQKLYHQVLSENADLVVMERNLDYLPLLLYNMNYMGMLETIYGFEDELNDVLLSNVKLGDELYQEWKHLNFVHIENKLKTFAKLLQLRRNQLELSSTQMVDADMKALGELVKDMRDIPKIERLIDQHLQLVRGIYKKLEKDLDSEYKYNIRESWVGIQNEIFDLGYSEQLARLKSLIELLCPSEIVLSLVALISLTHNGIKHKDLEAIEHDFVLNYGLSVAFMLRSFQDYKIVTSRTQEWDYFGAFKLGIGGPLKSSTATEPKRDFSFRNFDDQNQLGITGGQLAYKVSFQSIDKTLGLRSSEFENEKEVQTLSDYTDASFTMLSGAIPLMMRLFQTLYSRDLAPAGPFAYLHRPTWESVPLTEMLKGQTVDMSIKDTSVSQKTRVSRKQHRKRYIILVLVGGITRSEITVLKYLQEKMKKEIYVVTSGIVSNQKLVDAMS